LGQGAGYVPVHDAGSGAGVGVCCTINPAEVPHVAHDAFDRLGDSATAGQIFAEAVDGTDAVLACSWSNLLDAQGRHHLVTERAALGKKLAVAIGDGGSQNHRDHRSPGSRPVI